MKPIKNICLVDDDSVFHFITQKVIENTGLVESIKAFYNGREAMQFIKSALSMGEKLPDVILLDLNMPIMDGWDFLEEYITLKPELGKKITIYILSSSINPEDLKRAEAISEVSDFIVKPLTQDHLEKIIKTL